MNDLSFEVLNIIYDFCPDESYKIVDVNDIILALPEGKNLELDKLFQIIDDLATDASIMLKYRDEEDICLSIQAKGRRIVKKERETRARIEAQRKAKEEEEARQKAIREAEEKARLEREEQERLERIEKEKQLEEARLQLEELKAQKKSKKDHTVIELKQQVEELEKQIVEEEDEEPEPDSEPNEIPIISNVQTFDAEPMIKRVGRRAFWGGLIGAGLLNGLIYGIKYIIELLS